MCAAEKGSCEGSTYSSAQRQQAKVGRSNRVRTVSRQEELSAPAADPAAAIRIWEKGFSSHSKRGGNSFVRAADSTSAQLQKAEVGQLTNQITDTVVY